MPNKLRDGDSCAALLALGDEFARAATATSVYAALTRCGPAALGADRVVAFERIAEPVGDHTAFMPVSRPEGGAVMPFAAVWPITGTGAVSATDALETDSPYRSLFDAFTDDPPESLAHVPLGNRAVLVITWNSACTPDARDWQVIESIARQAASALERVDAIRRVRELSLRDPETGLGNRRLIEVVLQHSFAQALRGEPLSVVSLRRPDDASPATQTRLAQLLQHHARGSDVVAHVNDGVFVVVLHSASADGAGIFLRRVLAGFGEPNVSYAVAEHDGRFETADAMLHEVLAQVGVQPTAN